MNNYPTNKSFLLSSTILIAVLTILYSFTSYSEPNISTNHLLQFLNIIPDFIQKILFFILVPFLIFLFLQLVFTKHLPFLWATAFSAISVFSYINYDFKKFIFDFLLNREALSILKGKNLLLFENPSIAISILFFLLIIYICININKFYVKEIFLITLFWSLFSILNFSGAILGILFWLLYFSIKIYRLNKFSLKKITSIALSNILLFVFVILIFKNNISFNGIELEKRYTFDFSYFLFYFVLPIAFIFILFNFYKIDSFEIFIKFLPIYTLMCSDFLATVIYLNFGDSYINYDFFIYPHYILHFYYYVPIIYYLVRPLSPFIKNKPNVKNNFKIFINFVFSKLSSIYIPILMILLIFFVFYSGMFVV